MSLDVYCVKQKVVENSVRADSIESTGDVVCADVNQLDFDDVVLTAADVGASVAGPVRFTDGLAVDQLDVDDGALLNNVDLAELLNPLKVVVNSAVLVGGDADIERLRAPSLNDFDVSDLRRRFWTKSSDQDVDVELYVPTNVSRVAGDVSAATFLGRSLDDGFVRTARDATLTSDVTFGAGVAVADRMTLAETAGAPMNVHGVDLDTLHDQVVRRRGRYRVRGTKVDVCSRYSTFPLSKLGQPIPYPFRRRCAE